MGPSRCFGYGAPNMQQPPNDRGGSSRRRRQFLAAAASDRAARDVRLARLVSGYPVDYDPVRQDRLRPTAEFIGYRNSRLVASISSRPASAETAVDQFKLVCRTLAALDVDSVALVAGDELGLAVSATADHPSDLSPFVIGLTFGPAGVEPAGRLVPYQLDRQSRAVIWGEPREVRASPGQGLWAEVLGPMCLDRATVAAEASLEDLLDQNRRLGHIVLRL
jgi:hypothetical protein